jgi:hypothetical protein
MRPDFDFMDALYAVAANLFAALMTLLILAFDKPADLLAALRPAPKPETMQAVRFDLTEFSTAALGTDCFDFSAEVDPTSRQACIALFYVASQEMDYSNRDVRRSVSSATEAFRSAAAQTCREDWMARGSQSNPPISASCILLAQGLASRGDAR